MFGFLGNKPRSVPLEEQLTVLAQGGIALEPMIKPDSLLLSYSREQFEADPSRLLLCVMGGEPECEPQAGESGLMSDGIWHLDTECIEDHGSYAMVANRMSRLARGALAIEEPEDFVDIGGGIAWLAFTLDGVRMKWDAAVNDDWIDETILSRFVRLLDSRNTARRFTYTDLKGQDCLIGCAAPDERKWLRDKTGLAVEWLE